MSEENKIGAKVKLVRENRKLSIEDVSERTNLPAAQIQSIEDGSLVPNLTPRLLRLPVFLVFASEPLWTMTKTLDLLLPVHRTRRK